MGLQKPGSFLVAPTGRRHDFNAVISAAHAYRHMSRQIPVSRAEQRRQSIGGPAATFYRCRERLLPRRTLSSLLQFTHQIVDRRIPHNAVAVGRVVAVARVELLQKHANGIGSIRRSAL